MFGGLKEEIPIKIDIDEEKQLIKLEFDSEENFDRGLYMMENIWDNAIELLDKALQGDFKQINEIPNVDD